jgi:hypothetical protein
MKDLLKNIVPGDRIKFIDEKPLYTVIAQNNRFVICTRPYNVMRTCIYSIIDKWKGIRGTENLVFGLGFYTLSECQDALLRLNSKETEVSHRNFITTNIEKVITCNDYELWKINKLKNDLKHLIAERKRSKKEDRKYRRKIK